MRGFAPAEPGTEKDVQQALGATPAQAKAWLKRACDEGHVRKLKRPARYVAATHVHPCSRARNRVLVTFRRNHAPDHGYGHQ
jgi:hypothetical protein